MSSEEASVGLGQPLGSAMDRARAKLGFVLRMFGMQQVLFVAFTLVAAVPVFTLAWWVERRAVEQEIDAATDKHLLVARNLTAAFSRYVYDVKAGFRLAISTFYSGEQGEGLTDLLKSLEFRHICIVNAETGEVERYMAGFAGAPGTKIHLKPSTLEEFRKQLNRDDIVITDLRHDAAGKPTFFLLKALPEGRIAYGVIGTDYLVKSQRAIAFGARGHATVLDAQGKVVAHPFQNWIDSEFDLSKTPPAQAIMAGKSGVMQFYSPAFKADMITAYASVPETGWGVMVPQPMQELYAHADEVTKAATAVAFLGLVAAAAISWCLAKYIARPIKAVEEASGAVAGGDLSARAPHFASYVPHELHSLSGAFNHMIDEVSRKNHELAAAVTRAEAANRAKSEFLANMSHELRTPLNAIHGFAEMMREEVFGPLANERYKSYAGDISSSSEHLIKVITDILDLSKAESGMITAENAPVRVREVVDLAVRLSKQRAAEREIAIRLELALELDASRIETDRGKLTQILLNLLSNSVKFTEPGGVITVAGRVEQDFVEIAVRDTGIGIAEEDLAKVMTPFGQVASVYQTHEGFGLGLPLTNRLMEALGGSFTLSSVLGEGTTATVRLPRVPVEAAPELTRVA
jgi:signal transduction histidine kinase